MSVSCLNYKRIGFGFGVWDLDMGCLRRRGEGEVCLSRQGNKGGGMLLFRIKTQFCKGTDNEVGLVRCMNGEISGADLAQMRHLGANNSLP